MDTSGGVRPTQAEFDDARAVVAGTVAFLVPLVDTRLGRPRSLSVEGFLVAVQVNGSRRHHRGTLIEVARTLNAFSADQLDAVGIRAWDPVEAYDRVDRLFNKITKILDDPARQDADPQAVTDHLLDGSLHDLPARSRSVAVDGTDVETWATLTGELAEEDVDAEYRPEDETKPGDRTERPRRRRARVLGHGPDGRRIYTKDPDARAGHRSAVNSRGSGFFTGYEAHLAVQVPDVRGHNGIDQVSVGPDVPAVVTAFTLTPAGTNRAAIVPTLLALGGRGLSIDEVIWDRGYSQLVPEATAHPLRHAGIDQAFRPMEHQRKVLPYSEDAILIEGILHSAYTPEELRGPLPMPPMGAGESELRRYEQPFNQRARYRLRRHAGPDADGVTRWKCPFHAGALRSRELPRTMRGPRSAPLVDLPEGARCCSGIKSVPPADLPHWQRISPGTTAWRRSMGRRQRAEGANAGLKGGFVNIERKHIRVLGRTKMMFLLSFTIAGYNRDRIRAFLAKKAHEATAPRTRAKRRRGTYKDILGVSVGGSGRDPPAAATTEPD